MKLLTTIETILGLARVGVAFGKDFFDAVNAGKVEVQKDGAAMTAEELAADISATQAAALDAGDKAADRIAGRKQADGDSGESNED